MYKKNNNKRCINRIRLFLLSLIFIGCIHSLFKKVSQEDQNEFKFYFKIRKRSCEVNLIIFNENNEEDYYLNNDFFTYNKCDSSTYDYYHGYMVYDGDIRRFKRWIFPTQL